MAVGVPLRVACRWLQIHEPQAKLAAAIGRLAPVRQKSFRGCSRNPEFGLRQKILELVDERPRR